MTMLDRKHCHGCRNDYYNDGAGLNGVCWSRETGKVVTRYRIGTWTQPTAPGAFTQVRVPNCYHASGVHFTDRLPEFVKLNDVIGRKRIRPILTGKIP